MIQRRRKYRMRSSRMCGEKTKSPSLRYLRPSLLPGIRRGGRSSPTSAPRRANIISSMLGSTPAVSTSAAAPSYPKLSIPCIDTITTPQPALYISKTYPEEMCTATLAMYHRKYENKNLVRYAEHAGSREAGRSRNCWLPPGGASSRAIGR